MTWFEDVEVGGVRRIGPIAVTRDDVLDFAGKYDPQPFHLDDAAAAAHPFFGRLAASGWHTCALMMRLLVDDMVARDAKSLGSPGVDEIRWLKPVYPGDTLTLELEIVSAKRSQSRPEMGSTYQHYRVLNQHGVAVMTMKGAGLWRTRPGTEPTP
jgi:acyl dehydratase